MNQGKYVFAQLMDFVSRYEFNKCVKRYDGHHRVKSFSCWEQFLCLSFGQLTFRESLRDIVTCLRSRGNQLYHLGFRSKVSRSTLADANRRRDWRIYADFAQLLMKQARELYADEPEKELDIDHTVYALDASLIHLCLSVFFWTQYRKTTAAVKIHTLLDVQTALPQFFCITSGLTNELRILQKLLFEPNAFYVMDRGYLDFAQLYRIHKSGAFFVIRARTPLRFRRQYSRPKAGQKNIVFDQIGMLTVFYSRKSYPEKIRCVKAKDPDTGKSVLLLTNHMDLEARQVSDLYRYRWKIEIFFRWIKQHLRIKVFWGESENAVKTQIWAAVANYLIVAIARKRLGIQQNLYQILQILSVSAFDKTPLNQLLSKNGLQISKNDNLNQLNIFDL